METRLDVDSHLSIDELRLFLQEHGDVPDKDLARYIHRWWFRDDDSALRAAIEINPSWIRLFPIVADPTKDWSETLPSKAVSEFQMRTVIAGTESEAWEAWLERWLERQITVDRPSWTYPLSDLASRILSDDVLRSLVAGLRPAEAARLARSIAHAGLADRIFNVAPETIASGLREEWRLYEKQHGDQRWATLANLELSPLLAKALLRDELLLGFSLGVRATETGVGVKKTAFWRSSEFWQLAVTDATRLPDETLLQANLWALLRRLADLNRHSEKVEYLGVNAEVLAFGREHPDSWARALALIIDRSDLLRGVAESVTVLLATTSETVGQAVEAACNETAAAVRRERALGIRAMLNGIASPNSELITLVMDTISLWVDRTHIFPHPLSLPSSTWIGSLDLESALRAAVDTAELEFRDWFRSSGGLDEDIHTATLLAKLERSLANIELTLDGVANRRYRGPVAYVKYRQSSKQTEEPKYGLDLALTVKADVKSRLTYEAAQLVQVKKLRRDSTGTAFSDSWSIHVEQLRTLLGRTQSACYWMFDERGTVLAVPAKLLLGVATARPHLGATFSVSHFEIRAMATRLSQFFVDLFMSGWSADASQDVLQIARGDDRLIRPRIIVSVDVRWNQREDG